MAYLRENKPTDFRRIKQQFDVYLECTQRFQNAYYKRSNGGDMGSTAYERPKRPSFVDDEIQFDKFVSKRPAFRPDNMPTYNIFGYNILTTDSVREPNDEFVEQISFLDTLEAVEIGTEYNKNAYSAEEFKTTRRKEIPEFIKRYVIMVCVKNCPKKLPNPQYFFYELS